MERLAVVALALALAAPSTASADCLTTCGDICNAPEASALFRAEVVATMQGFVPRVRIVERLGGSAEVPAEIDDEIDDVYTEDAVAVGDQLLLVLMRLDDGSGHRQWTAARPIEGEQVVCSSSARTVPLPQYLAMAASASCEKTADDLGISNRCDDTPGCASVGAPSLLAALALLGLGARRRLTRPAAPRARRPCR